MIPNISKGKDVKGLVYYLFSDGKANEHENQHIVCGSKNIEKSYLKGSYLNEKLERQVLLNTFYSDIHLLLFV